MLQPDIAYLCDPEKYKNVTINDYSFKFGHSVREKAIIFRC